MAPTTAISICCRYSSRDVAAARARGRERHVHGGQELVRPAPSSRPGPAKRSADARPGARRSAAVQRRPWRRGRCSGPPVSIAGEAFITLPPIVPWARVACEPTIADASARAVSRSRTTGWPAISCVARRARRGAAPSPIDVDAAQLGDAVDRDEAVRERRLALARADDEIGAAGDRPGAGRRAPRPPRRRVGRERTRSSRARASQTRSGVIGSCAHARADRPSRSRSRPLRRWGRTAARRRPSTPSARRSACRSRSTRCRSAARRTR